MRIPEKIYPPENGDSRRRLTSEEMIYLLRARIIAQTQTVDRSKLERLPKAVIEQEEKELTRLKKELGEFEKKEK